MFLCGSTSSRSQIDSTLLKVGLKHLCLRLVKEITAGRHINFQPQMLNSEILSPPCFLGPRWASWNLGVFMCIRCAGIHRNLGVHISRVKSVNLDQWTPEQIQVFKDMPNGHKNA